VNADPDEWIVMAPIWMEKMKNWNTAPSAVVSVLSKDDENKGGK
jgi:hypothetical protein